MIGVRCKNRVKLLIKDVCFGLGIRVEYVVVFERWYALLITTCVFQKGEKFFAVASVVRVVEAQEIFEIALV